MEANHLACKDELCELYERKLEYERKALKKLKLDQV
jgi:hypothetical protein